MQMSRFQPPNAADEKPVRYETCQECGEPYHPDNYFYCDLCEKKLCLRCLGTVDQADETLCLTCLKEVVTKALMDRDEFEQMDRHMTEMEKNI